MAIRRLGGSLLLLAVFFVTPVAHAQIATYRQLGAIGFALPYSQRGDNHNLLSVEPLLPGLRNRSVEILTDAMLRKQPRTLNSPAEARSAILRQYKSSPGQLRGVMAEALFVDRNPEWKYVRSPIARQHDVTRPGPGKAGGGPVRWNGQIKYHISGNPTQYAADMLKDSRAHRFFIPDDHVEPLKAYLKGKAEVAQARGESESVRRLYRDYARVRPIGATSAEINREMRKAVRDIASEKYAAYRSLGAALAIGFGPMAWEWASGKITSNVVAYRAGKEMSMIAVGGATNMTLAKVADGALRGTIRGNVITGLALTAVDTAWLLRKYGWRDAFYRPDFYKELAGGVSGLTLAIAGFSASTVLFVETGPFAPVLGAGVGIATGTVGYLGGRTATHFIIETFWPELLRKQERERIAAVKQSIMHRLAELQTP